MGSPPASTAPAGTGLSLDETLDITDRRQYNHCPYVEGVLNAVESEWISHRETGDDQQADEQGVGDL